MNNIAAEIETMRHFKLPKTVISRFIARRTIRSAAFWALAFGAIVASKSVGYAAAYPTIQARAKLVATFSQNIGLSALFGAPHRIETVAGFTVWNTLAGMMIIGSIWAFLLATKTLRGEESAGRWEILLAGQTTSRRAAANALAGLGVSLITLYVVAAAVFIGIGKVRTVNFGVHAALFFALSAIGGAVMFMAVGALASQLMPTRSRAASLSAGLFGLFFLVRAMANTTNVHWLLNFSPLGWIDKLQPLYGSQPLWLLPIGGLTLILCGLTIFLAGRRDLGDSIFVDKDSSKPHTSLLNTPLTSALRLTRSASLSWLAVFGLVAVFFSLLSKSATQAFTQSASFAHEVTRVLHSTQTLGALTFLGIIFFLLMPLLMAYAASAIGHVREDEAEGYVDNFLVRPISRMQWLSGRILLIVIVVALAGLLSGVGAWLGAASQHSGIAFHSLLLAGLNIIAPALLILGIGIFIFGVVPRLTTVVTYGVIAWSFLLQIVSSGINISHWVLDSSIFHHLALAPAASPNWNSAAILVVIGVGLSLIGATAFNRRDMANE